MANLVGATWSICAEYVNHEVLICLPSEPATTSIVTLCAVGLEIGVVSGCFERKVTLRLKDYDTALANIWRVASANVLAAGG